MAEGPQRPPDRDRRVLPRPGAQLLAHARRCGGDSRRAAAGPRGVPESLRSRLHLVPRYRQKLKSPRFERWGGRSGSTTPDSTWSTTFASPRCPLRGRRTSCASSPAEVFSQRLDRSKPLWELVVQGLDDGRFALVTKTHHAMIDGVAGVDIATVLFDLTPDPSENPRPTRRVPSPESLSGGARGRGREGAMRTPIDLAGQALDAVQHPRTTASRAVEAAEALGEVAWAGLNPAPGAPLNVEIGPHRSVHWVRAGSTTSRRSRTSWAAR